MEGEVTLRDLAAQLGVSVATVSRALNYDDTVSKKTQKRVFELAERVGYRKNEGARLLRTGRSNTIGCIVPRMDDHLMASIVSGIEKTAQREELSVILMQSHDSREREAYCANLLLNKRVDGLIIAVSGGTDNLCHLESFLQKKAPVVLLDHPQSPSSFTNIIVDNCGGAYEVTRHLLAQGRRRIVHITASGLVRPYAERCEGYKQALSEAGLATRDSDIIKGDLTRDGGVKAVRSIWQWSKRPDAIFAASDICAIGCIDALRERGMRIPDDLAVAGFGNDPVSLASMPALTTVSLPGHTMGDAAVQQMIRCLEGSAVGRMVDAISMRSDLIVRRSTSVV